MTTQQFFEQLTRDLHRIEATQHVRPYMLNLPSKEMQQAWDELQAVPSYVETQAQAWASELNIEIA